MNQVYIKELHLNPDHRFELISSRNECRKGQDTNFYEYREYDQDDNLVGTLTVVDSIDIYPPHYRTIDACSSFPRSAEPNKQQQPSGITVPQ